MLNSLKITFKSQFENHWFNTLCMLSFGVNSNRVLAIISFPMMELEWNKSTPSREVTESELESTLSRLKDLFTMLATTEALICWHGYSNSWSQLAKTVQAGTKGGMSHLVPVVFLGNR